MTSHPSIDVIGPCPAPFNLAAYVLDAGQAVPDKVALTIAGTAETIRWTYADLTNAVAGTAQGLRALGLMPGARVLMRLGNTADFPIVFLGAIHAGLVPIPTSPQLTLPEVTAIAAETRPACIVAAPGLPTPPLAGRVIDTETLAAWRALPGQPPEMVDPNTLAYIIYTSGTSGSPRAVMHAHRAIWARRMMREGWYGLQKGDVMLHAGAFNWTYTLGTGLLDPWSIGATAVIPESGADIADLPQHLAQHDVTLFAAAPGVYRRLVRQDLPPFPKLRHGLSAGEKLPAVTAERWQAATGTPIFEAYGMSECSTFISTAPGRASQTLGWPQPGRAITLRGSAGAVPQGEAGMIAIHKDDPGLMLGYLGAPEDTSARFEGDWFMTGDLGRMAPDGSIAYEGRADDMINAGGFRVSPLEIEAVLSRFAGITEVAAVELRTKEDTSIVAAFYVGPKDIDDRAVSAFAARTLAGYKLPRTYIRVPELPRGTNNKLLRQRLRLDWETHHGQT